MNLRPSGYEPDELPDCSTPRLFVWWFSVHRRSGGDLLSRALRRSTIGAEGFHGRVRDGIGCWGPRCDHQTVDERKPALAALVSCVIAAVIGYVWFMWGSRRGIYRCARWAGGRSCDHCSRFLHFRDKIKPIERLVPVSFTHCCASTPGLSTWWSSTVLKRDLVSRGVSRLDAFSGYPVRI